MLQGNHLADARYKALRALVAQALGAGGGGGGGALSRFKFIDGGATESTRNGSPSPAAYKSVSEWLAALPVTTTAADSQAQQAGLVTPCLAGYTENVTFPAFRNVSLFCDTVGGVAPGAVFVTGNAVWHNVAGTNHAPTTISLLEIGVPFTGTFTGTDDGSSPSEIFLQASPGDPDEVGMFSSINTSGMTALSALAMFGGGTQGAANIGAAVPVVMDNGVVSGLLTAQSVTAVNSSLGSCTLTTGHSSEFQLSTFVSTPVLTAPGHTLHFDGSSYRNFLEQGGTVAGAGAIVLVIGGFYAAAVEGANIGDVPAVLTLNGTGAGATWAAGGNHYSQNAAITGNRVIQIATGGGELTGDTLRVTRTVTDANGFHLTFEDDTGATLGTLAGANRGCFDFRFNGTHWVMFGGGGGLT